MPQFLLRNYSHPFGKRNQKKRLYHDTKVVNVLDLSKDEPALSEQRVNRTFGQYDMYCDHAALAQGQKRRIETELGKLENNAAPVFKKLLQAQVDGDKNDGDHYADLLQFEQFFLKKFMFVMKYRSQVFYERFNHEHKEDYQGKDKDKMLKYMRKKKFQRPLDVWFDNLMQIMTLKVEGEVDWCNAIEKLIYPQDALWLKLYMRLKYPVVCTPLNQDEEFVLTGHAFCLHEGPSDDLCTTELHTVCVMAPRLAVLMRDDALPELMDDQDAARQEQNQQMLAAQVSTHRHPELATSLLETLRVVKPRSTYTQDSNGQLIYSWSHPKVEYRAKTLCFPISKVGSEHVQYIDSVILNEAYDLPEIVYNKKPALLLALEAFLRMPIEGYYSLKNYPSEDDARVVYLKKLERFVHSLGSEVKSVYKLPTTYTIAIPELSERPYHDLPSDASSLCGYPLPRAQHTAGMPTPFRPENEHMFKSSFMRQMAREGRTPTLEDLHAIERSMAMMGIHPLLGMFSPGM